jgi:DNA processing protein
MTSAADAEDRLARVALTWAAEPGNRAIWQMVQQRGAAATLEQVCGGELRDGGLRAGIRASAAEGDPRRFAEKALRRAERLGARVVVPSDADWPPGVESLALLELDAPGRVNHDTRPPLCLWVRGSRPVADAFERSVAVVGARASTAYGEHVTSLIAAGVADEGWTVVSGGAVGIDATAHRAALAAGGFTVAVLACGVDRPYPAGNSGMLEQIADSGLLVSEWPPGSDPLRHRFLIRNRVIAAATAGTVMIEAAARSGALQTMNRVVALNRHAMVVPGPVTSAMSVGCHELLRRTPTARLVTSAAQVLDEVGRIGEYVTEPERAPEHARDHLDEESALLLEAMPARGTITPEELAARAGLSLRTVLRRLSLLEIKDLIVRRDDGFALGPAARTTRRRTAEKP